MFKPSARYYDKIYVFKDYQAEAAKLMQVIAEYKQSPGNSLLDVACGTGHHLDYLKERFNIEGLDLEPGLLEAARQRLPGVTFHQADMTAFDLGRRFDVLTCLFSAIGYVMTMDGLGKALTCMAAHLLPGGLLAVEPWFTPETWRAGTVHALLVDEPELKIARLNLSGAKGRISFMDFHYLVATPQGVEHFTEWHELGLFTVEEMQSAIAAAGLAPAYDPEGLTGRGLHLGVKPL